MTPTSHKTKDKDTTMNTTQTAVTGKAKPAAVVAKGATKPAAVVAKGATKPAPAGTNKATQTVADAALIAKAKEAQVIRDAEIAAQKLAAKQAKADEKAKADAEIAAQKLAKKAASEAKKAEAEAEAEAKKAAREAEAQARAHSLAVAAAEAQAARADFESFVAEKKAEIEHAEAVIAAAKAEIAEARKTLPAVATGSGALASAASRYTRHADVKTASGAASIDNGDEVAEMLRGMDLDATYAKASKVLELPEADLRAKYAHLNLGMQRMNLGNRIRGVLNGK